MSEGRNVTPDWEEMTYEEFFVGFDRFMAAHSLDTSTLFATLMSRVFPLLMGGSLGAPAVPPPLPRVPMVAAIPGRVPFGVSSPFGPAYDIVYSTTAAGNNPPIRMLLTLFFLNDRRVRMLFGVADEDEMGLPMQLITEALGGHRDFEIKGAEGFWLSLDGLIGWSVARFTE